MKKLHLLLCVLGAALSAGATCETETLEAYKPDPDAGAPFCMVQGKRYERGDLLPRTDCNSCWCEGEGKLKCTTAECHDGGPAACEYQGKRYEMGAQFPSADGCNTCSCASGGVACTDRACADKDGGAAVCAYGGKRYEAGASFPSEDGCNTCSCMKEGVACTTRACPRPDGGPAVCAYNGKRYEAGATFPSEDGCNECTCLDNGGVGCTKIACPKPDAGPLVCAYGGKRYEVGASFPSEDGCNTCTCTREGGVACTERACPTPGCTYGGKRYEVGASFPSEDGCNECTCGEGGGVGCTKRGCPAPDAGSAACLIPHRLTFALRGNRLAYHDESEISDFGMFSIRRVYGADVAQPRECAVRLSCNPDMAAVREALAHPEVARVLGLTVAPTLGEQPPDAGTFVFRIGGGRGFDLEAGGEAPAGIRALRALLDRLKLAVEGSEACAKLRP